MKLKECMELGSECGLTTLEECYLNVEHLATSLFKYEDINKELLELQQDIFYNYPYKFCRIFDSDKEDLIKKGWKTK